MDDEAPLRCRRYVYGYVLDNSEFPCYLVWPVRDQQRVPADVIQIAPNEEDITSVKVSVDLRLNNQTAPLQSMMHLPKNCYPHHRLMIWSSMNSRVRHIARWGLNLLSAMRSWTEAWTEALTDSCHWRVPKRWPLAKLAFPLQRQAVVGSTSRCCWRDP